MWITATVDHFFQLAEQDQQQLDEEKRATWLETRNLEENFKELVYLSIQEVNSNISNLGNSRSRSTTEGIEPVTWESGMVVCEKKKFHANGMHADAPTISRDSTRTLFYILAHV